MGIIDRFKKTLKRSGGQYVGQDSQSLEEASKAEKFYDDRAKLRAANQRIQQKIQRERIYSRNPITSRTAQLRQITQRNYKNIKGYGDKRVSLQTTQALASIGGVGVKANKRYTNINPLLTAGETRSFQNRRGAGYGRRGRPKGAYDNRYAQYGGVYGYRKFIAQQRRLQAIQAQAQFAKNPQLAQEMAYQNENQPLPEQNMPNQANMPMNQQYSQQQAPIPQKTAGISLWDNSFMKLDTGQGKPISNAWQEAMNPETPAGDPKGDYYTEPDFFSGKQVLRRRSGDRLFKW